MSNLDSAQAGLKKSSNALSFIVNPMGDAVLNAQNQVGNDERDVAATNLAALTQLRQQQDLERQSQANLMGQSSERSDADRTLQGVIQRKQQFQGLGGNILTGPSSSYAKLRGGASTVMGQTLGGSSNGGNTLLGQ
jgi:hypothetical protein